MINIKPKPVLPSDPNYIKGMMFVRGKELWIGAGTGVFKANKEGVFAGSDKYSNAPFKLSYAGVLYATAGEIAGNFLVSGYLQAGDPDAANAIFGTSGGNSGLLIYNGDTYKGGLFYGTNATTLDSIDDLFLTVAAGKSLGFAVDGIIKASINPNGDITAAGDYYQGAFQGYTGDLNDSTSTKIATVKGGIIVAVDF